MNEADYSSPNGEPPLPRCKMLQPLAGQPVLAWTVQRTQQAHRIDQIVVATSDSAEDDELADWCLQQEIAMLPRLLRTTSSTASINAPKPTPPITLVRLTGDCPLLDPQLIDDVVDLCFKDATVDYASNVEPMTYPEGMSVEVIPFHALEVAWLESTLPSHREHVTPFLRFHADRFRHAVLLAQPSLQHYRLTVDYEADLEALERLIHRLSAQTGGFDFALHDVLAVIDLDPTIAAALNGKQRDLWRQEVMRDEGRVDVARSAVLATD
ncbi:MAG: NTP transferase domain-containing protein [Caldilineaceae bacterium]